MDKSKSQDLQPVSVHNTKKQVSISLPKPSGLEESSHVDLNQFIFNDDTICEQMFGRIIDSPAIHPQNEETITLSPDSPPISQAPYPPTTPFYPPIKPLPQTNTYTHSVLDTGPCYDQSVTPHSSTRMRVPSLCSPVRPSPIYESCCVEHQPQYINCSSQEQRRYTYPGNEGTHSTHVMCSHSQTPFECGECPYSHEVTRKSLARPVSMPINDHSQVYCTRSLKSDQFSSITPNSSLLLVPTSRKNTYMTMASSPNNLSHSTHSTPYRPFCVTCGYENNFVDSRECDSYTQSNSQIPSEREVVSTHESNDYLEDSVCSSQIIASQDSILSSSSSQQTAQSPFDCLSREAPDLNSESTDPQKSFWNQKKKEQRKRNSERERKRLREINRALQDLGDICCFHTHERAHTKVGTIEQAVTVISKMQTSLAYKISAENNTKS